MNEDIEKIIWIIGLMVSIILVYECNDFSILGIWYGIYFGIRFTKKEWILK